jgi:pyruvate formate lyase activating enzyme
MKEAMLYEGTWSGYPLVYSRFSPAYKMQNVPSIHCIGREIGLEAGLRYVYVGNVHDEINTSCPECGRLLIKRSDFFAAEKHLNAKGGCPGCKTVIAGVGIKKPEE